MTAPMQLTPVAPSARLAALGRRSGSGRPSTGSDNVSFEALLAKAGEPTDQWGQVTTADLVADAQARSSSALVAAQTQAQPAAGLANLLSMADGPTAALLNGTSLRPATSGQAVIEAAKTHLGVPYLWGGTDAEHGFDCSGLVQDAYRQIGVEMPKWSRHQATMGAEVASIEEALPGDVIAFGQPVSHVSLYMGDGQMLHAPKTGEVVKIGPIDRPIATIRRIVTPAAAGVEATLGSGLRLAAPSGNAAGAVTASGPTAPAGISELEQLYQPLFAQAGQRWNVDPALLAAVAKTESAFDRNAVSPVGARGLMQFMPATAAEMGVDPLDPASAIDGAARYLRKSLDQFTSVDLAVASYNAGRGAVSRHGGIPPYPETQRYVQKVLDAWRSRS